MGYKTELHCHSSEVSQCARISVEEIIENYLKEGVSTLVLTNHFSIPTFEHIKDASWREKCDYFLSAYKKAKEIAGDKMTILLGMEFRNIYSDNDYLIYGMTEEFIYKHNTEEKNLIDMHLKEVATLAREEGMLVFQAHPFRNGMTVINPKYLDGIEVNNGHRRHDSRNDIAALWADKFSLLRCGGSDCHEVGDEAYVLLVTDKKIKTNKQLIKAVKSEIVLDCK